MFHSSPYSFGSEAMYAQQVFDKMPTCINFSSLAFLSLHIASLMECGLLDMFCTHYPTSLKVKFSLHPMYLIICLQEFSFNLCFAFLH